MGLISDQLESDPGSMLESLPGKSQVDSEQGKEMAGAPAAEPAGFTPVVGGEAAPVQLEKHKIVSEFFGQEFKDDDEAKTYVSSLKSREEEFGKLQSRVQELESGIDPLQFFTSEEEFRRQQLMRKFPDLDPQVVGKIAMTDPKEVDVMQALQLHVMLKDPDIYKTDEDAIELLEERYGITIDSDLDLNEIPRNIKNKILKDAKEARAAMAEIKDQVNPGKVDIVTKAQQITAEQKLEIEKLKSSWKPILEQIPGKVKKITWEDKAKDGQITKFDFEVSDDYMKNLAVEIEKSVEILAQRGVQITDETKSKLLTESVAVAQRDYIGRNYETMFRALKNQMDKDYADKLHKALHNPRPLNQGESPEIRTRLQLSKEQAEDIIERRLKGERV